MNAIDQLRKNDMMCHLLDALDEGKDIGHYGRLVFAMIAHHFMEEEALVKQLSKCQNFDEEQARALVMQVKAHGYSPPSREKIRQFQSRQPFPICPSDDPDGCNVYKNLNFPPEVYQHIQEYYEQKAHVEAST
jgi:DNA primase large subunit